MSATSTSPLHTATNRFTDSATVTISDSAANEAGWLSPAPSYVDGAYPTLDSMTPWRLFHDLHYTGAGSIFEVDLVPNQVYQVSVTSGHWFVAHSSQFAAYDAAVGPDGGVTQAVVTEQNEFAVLLFEQVPVGDSGKLRLEMSYVDPQLVQDIRNAVINGLDIRPGQAVGGLELSRQDLADPAVPVVADGLTTDTYTGEGAPPHTLITLTATGGMLIDSDADRYYRDVQVITDAQGRFTFQLLRPTGDFPVDVVAFDTTGRSLGKLTQAYELPPITQATTRQFDFNAPLSPTAPGYVGVLPTDLYGDPYRGFG